MKRHLVYVLKSSLDRNEPMYYTTGEKLGSVRMAFERRLNAETRTEAIKKCLPEIGKLIDTINDPTIRFVSVFAGTVSGVGKAERLTPIQIDVKTKTFRKL